MTFKQFVRHRFQLGFRLCIYITIQVNTKQICIIESIYILFYYYWFLNIDYSAYLTCSPQF